MQKEQQNTKKNLLTPAISTSYLYELQTADLAWKLSGLSDQITKYKSTKSSKST